MQRIAVAAGILLGLLTWSKVSAQVATQDINITATVAGMCTIDGLSSGTVANVVIPTPNATVDVTPITLSGGTFANVVCNGPSTLLLTSLNGGVLNPVPAAGLDNVINYLAAATWNSVTASVNTSTNPAASLGGSEAGTPALVASAGSGGLSVTITPTANGQPLAIGNYSDTLRVTLTPQ